MSKPTLFFPPGAVSAPALCKSARQRFPGRVSKSQVSFHCGRERCSRNVATGKAVQTPDADPNQVYELSSRLTPAPVRRRPPSLRVRWPGSPCRRGPRSPISLQPAGAASRTHRLARSLCRQPLRSQGHASFLPSCW